MQLWAVKQPQLQSVDYHIGHVGPITVQKGTAVEARKG
jgi:hypothetical protein